jgi:hypothetical protein
VLTAAIPPQFLAIYRLTIILHRRLRSPLYTKSYSHTEDRIPGIFHQRIRTWMPMILLGMPPQASATPAATQRTQHNNTAVVSIVTSLVS